MRYCVGQVDGPFDFLSFCILFSPQLEQESEDKKMVGTTSAVQTVQETSLSSCEVQTLRQAGRLLLQAGISTADAVSDVAPITASEKHDLLLDLGASNANESRSKQNDTVQELKILITGDVVGLLVEGVGAAPLADRGADLLPGQGAKSGELQDTVVKLLTSEESKSSFHNQSAVVVEHIRHRPKWDGRPGSDIFHIRRKTAGERRTELILKNREKQDKTVTSQSEAARWLYSRLTVWNFVVNTWPMGVKQTYWKMCRAFEAEAPRGLGKFTGKGLTDVVWGETLFDFFHLRFNRPPTESSKAYSSSMLYNWVRTHDGDIPFSARRLMRLAEREDRPRLVPVYSIEQLIRTSEAWVREQEAVSWNRPCTPDAHMAGKTADPWDVPESWPPDSVFSPLAYPAPWPFEPFKKQSWHPEETFGSFAHKPKLQHYIPQHLLPETLFVHDPYEILNACGKDWDRTPWVEKDDIVRIYKRNVNERKKSREIQDIKEYEEEGARVKGVRDAFLGDPHSRMELPEGMVYHPDPPSELKLGPCKPPVYVVFPPKPPQPPAKSAHLYISPAARLGKGNHSYVYQAEFEVPRSFLVSEEICRECVLQDVKRILEDEDGLVGERRNARWDELSGRYTVKVRGKPARNVMLGDEEYEFIPDSRGVEVVYEGPYRAIQTRINYQNLERAPYCEHLRKDHIHPLTTKVEVAAKLSKRYDDHLNVEADNYRSFPKDFFEHYNGFNVVNPLKEPTPVGAIVPQFYGYYTLDKDDERNKEWANGYWSPILLVEDCGVSINTENTSLDDDRECISLFYRMHAAGYQHGSPYSRNVVRQPGPLKDHPFVRQRNSMVTAAGCIRVGIKWNYRLIDFGRTRHKEAADPYDFEEIMDWEKGKMRKWLTQYTLA